MKRRRRKQLPLFDVLALILVSMFIGSVIGYAMGISVSDILVQEPELNITEYDITLSCIDETSYNVMLLILFWLIEENDNYDKDCFITDISLPINDTFFKEILKEELLEEL